MTLAEVRRILRKDYTRVAGVVIDRKGCHQVPRYTLIVAKDERSLARITGDIWLIEQIPAVFLPADEHDDDKTVAVALDLETGDLISIGDKANAEEVRDCFLERLMRRNPFTGEIFTL